MKLAHILVCHTTDPTKAIESIPSMPDALWYVFLHSDDAVVERAVIRLMADRSGNIFDYKINRGLARSWNEGLHLAFEAGCDAALLLNDDLFFYEQGYVAFVHTIGAVKNISRNVSYVTPLGLETGTSGESGKTQPQQFACCAIMPECVALIGYFDETFTPAYYEDIDYDRRALLAGMTVHVHQAVIVEHERSSTHRNMSQEAKSIADASFLINKAYFERKWGPGGIYQAPFGDINIGLSIQFSNRRNPYDFSS